MKKQKGQALILIAFGIIAMLGMTALAIDGGNAFADRRHAQNAADTAALSAALAKINDQDWDNAAYIRAESNGYDDDGVTNIVEVHSPPAEGQYACPAANCNEYIQVIITSHVDTWFAKIIGVEQVTNRVQAVAKAKPLKPYYDGHAVVSLSPGDGKDNTPEFEFNGSASEVGVSGSGVFINSKDNCVMKTNGSPDVTIPYITTAGTICEATGIPTNSGPQYPYPPDYSHLDDLCSRSNAVQVSGDFPKSNTPANLPSNTIYCISGNFKITSNNTVLNGTGITFVVAGEVNINGGTLNLSSPSSLPLFYLPYAANKFKSDGISVDNQHNVTISGNADTVLTGQVLAPASHCGISGTGDTNPLKGQLICYTVALGGDALAQIQYDDNDNMDEPPQIELTE